MTDPYFVRKATAPEIPLLVSIPHAGVEVPDGVASRFASPSVAALPDTDWHLDRLYAFVPELGARTLLARFSRFVVDLNRPPDGGALYPGRDETGVVPTSTFASEAIYRAGQEPSPDEVAERIDRHHRPYHERIALELGEIRDRFGYALLFDAHSIASEVPRLFEGRLPGLVLGDVNGTSAAPEIGRAVLEVHRASGLTFRANDPFRGGYITRRYGRPAGGVHALQLEMSQRLYMDEGAPFVYRKDRAERLVPTLRRTLDCFVEAARALVGSTRGRR